MALLLAVAGCGDSASGAENTAVPRVDAAKPVGQPFRLADGAGDAAELTLKSVADPPHAQVDVAHSAGTRVFGLEMQVREIAGAPGYTSAPVVIGTDHRTYYANSSSSPPEPTDITVSLPRHVSIACVHDTINGGTRTAAWRVGSGGCPPG